MELRNCVRCGKFYEYFFGENICPACKKIEDDAFSRVRDYLREHNGATIDDVVDNCEVTMKTVTRWIREERLELTGGINYAICCEACGQPITKGKFCDKCLMQINKNFKASISYASANKNKEQTNKMRFLGKSKK